MPNRMIRDWTGSDKVNSLSSNAERFFVRLIMKVDDYGCFYADVRLLKANLFPLLLNEIREADLLRWMAECQKAGLIALYEHADKKYLQILDFGQRLRQKTTKFPMPQHGSALPTIDSNVRPEVEVEEEGKEKKKPADAGAADLSPVTNEKKEKEKSPGPEISMPFGDQFKPVWDGWKSYKQSEFKFHYKSRESEEAALASLVKLSGGDPGRAMGIIEQSKANGWKGFFDLKSNSNGAHQQDSGKSTTRAKPSKEGANELLADFKEEFSG